MKTSQENPERLDQRLLDRLVDAELSDPERQVLLARLDQEPDGWRRCALAFLEAQAWRDALGAAAEIPLPGATPRAASQLALALPTPPESSTRRRRRYSMRSAVEVAAALLVAFALGISVGVISQPRSEMRMDQQFAGSTPLQTPNDQAVPIPETDEPQFSPEGVPVLVGARGDEQWLHRHASALPINLQRLWERQGYSVVQRRRLVSMDLDGGGSLAIPVDEVELRYVGTRSY